MKKTRFTEEQMVTILREAEEKPVPEPADVKRLRQLEQENGRLKRLVPDRVWSSRSSRRSREKR